MDVDEDEDGTQRPKAVNDFGIEVDFDSVDDDERDEDPTEAIAKFDKEISNMQAEIERMAPNMKAIERYDIFIFSKLSTHICSDLTMSKRSWRTQNGKLTKPAKTLKLPVIISTM